MKVAGPPAIATSLARSMGSTRWTSQIKESIKVNDNLNHSTGGTEFSETQNKRSREQIFHNSYNFCNYGLFWDLKNFRNNKNLQERMSLRNRSL